MNIRKLDWGDRVKYFLPLKYVDFIVVHHTADNNDLSIEEIDDLHQNRPKNPFYGCGYHFVIRRTGDVEIGRPEHIRGAQAYGYNHRSIGVVLNGDFTARVPTEAQMETLVWVIQDLKSRYPEAEIVGHRDLMPTQCPGNSFPWEELISRLEEEQVAKDNTLTKQQKDAIMTAGLQEGVITQMHESDAPAEKWFAVAVARNQTKIIKDEIKRLRKDLGLAE